MPSLLLSELTQSCITSSSALTHAMSAALVSHTRKWLHFNYIPLSVILGFQSSPVISSPAISDSPLRQHYCHTEVLSHVFSWHNCNCCTATSKVPHVTSTTRNFLANILNTCWSDHITKIPWQLASYCWQPTLWSMGCFLSCQLPDHIHVAVSALLGEVVWWVILAEKLLRSVSLCMQSIVAD